MTDLDYSAIAKEIAAKIDTGKIMHTANLEMAHYTKPESIVCKWCGADDIKKYGVRDGVQEYLCLKCNRKFIQKDAPFKKQSPIDQIGSAMSMYFDGLSFADIARQLGQTYNNPVNESTVYRWVMSYTQKAVSYFEQYHPKVSDTIVVDETILKIKGENLYFWDVIDGGDSRFLIASHLSGARTGWVAGKLMEKVKAKIGKAPRFILSDGLTSSYPEGIKKAFGDESIHIVVQGLTAELNTNLIERFHSTIKERTKVLRGFKTPQTALVILNGFLVHYNYFKPHMGLIDVKPKGIEKTPAEVARDKNTVQNMDRFCEER